MPVCQLLAKYKPLHFLNKGIGVFFSSPLEFPAGSQRSREEGDPWGDYGCSISCKLVLICLTFALLQQHQVAHKIWLYFLVVLPAKVCGSDVCFTIVKYYKHSLLGQSGQMLRIHNWSHGQNFFQDISVYYISKFVYSTSEGNGIWGW